MALRLRLTSQSTIPVEVDAIRLETVREQSADEVARTPVYHGNRQLPLGEFFDVSGSAAGDSTLVWEGDCRSVKQIAHQLREGTVIVEGNAGMHAGAEMRGGTLEVRGNSGDWVGAEMHGGRITVTGNAGHLVGSVYRGGRRGMTGGQILIHGDAGNEIGHTMRRGLIAVGGRSGDAAGFGMIAGSILLFGETGIRPGAGMKRGSIIAFGQAAAIRPLPTFQFACRYRPQFLAVYLKQLQASGFPVPAEAFQLEFDRYLGDFIELGKGELLKQVAA